MAIGKNLLTMDPLLRTSIFIEATAHEALPKVFRVVSNNQVVGTMEIYRTSTYYYRL